MINWIFKHKAEILVYLFYSPWTLMLFVPLTPFYGDSLRVFIPISIIICLQMILYYIFTWSLVKKLVFLDINKISRINTTTYSWLSIINIVIVIVAFFVLWFGNFFYFIILFLIFIPSELYRVSIISNLIVILEQENNVLASNKLMTFFLIINPLLGLWSLHTRIKRLLESAKQ